MANLILASKREVKSGAIMWHVYRSEDSQKSAEFYFTEPLKALRYAFILRKRTGAVIPKAIYNRLMADVKASQPQPQAEAEQQEQPTAEVVGEPSPLARQYEEMKAKHADCILLFRCGDFYAALGEDGAAVAEICGLVLTRNEQAQDITREQCAFPAHALDRIIHSATRFELHGDSLRKNV